MGDSARTVKAASPRGYVALTFDDGPTENTRVLLAALEKAGVRATLFNVGENAAANPELVAAEVAAGMWVGNHSYTHPHMPALSRTEMHEELLRTQEAIAAAGGGTPLLFRPPYGEKNDTLEEMADGLGLLTVTWDVDCEDWNGAGTEAIVAAAAKLRDGDVLLMHDRYATTVAAIPKIVANLARRGLAAGKINSATGRAVAPKG